MDRAHLWAGIDQEFANLLLAFCSSWIELMYKGQKYKWSLSLKVIGIGTQITEPGRNGLRSFSCD